VSARTGSGVDPVRIFYGQGGPVFLNLCGRLVWTAPYEFYSCQIKSSA